jgi:hypothetical protein
MSRTNRRFLSLITRQLLLAGEADSFVAVLLIEVEVGTLEVRKEVEATSQADEEAVPAINVPRGEDGEIGKKSVPIPIGIHVALLNNIYRIIALGSLPLLFLPHGVC